MYCYKYVLYNIKIVFFLSKPFRTALNTSRKGQGLIVLFYDLLQEFDFKFFITIPQFLNTKMRLYPLSIIICVSVAVTDRNAFSTVYTNWLVVHYKIMFI